MVLLPVDDWGCFVHIFSSMFDSSRLDLLQSDRCGDALLLPGFHYLDVVSDCRFDSSVSACAHSAVRVVVARSRGDVDTQHCAPVVYRLGGSSVCAHHADSHRRVSATPHAHTCQRTRHTHGALRGCAMDDRDVGITCAATPLLRPTCELLRPPLPPPPPPHTYFGFLFTATVRMRLDTAVQIFAGSRATTRSTLRSISPPVS